MIRLKSIHSILLFQKTDGSAQTSRHYHWVDGHQPNRFKPTHIYLKQTCLLLGEDKNKHTKYKKIILRHCLFDRKLGKGINQAIARHDALQTNIGESSFKKMRFR